MRLVASSVESAEGCQIQMIDRYVVVVVVVVIGVAVVEGTILLRKSLSK